MAEILEKQAKKIELEKMRVSTIYIKLKFNPLFVNRRLGNDIAWKVKLGLERDRNMRFKR